MKRVFIASIIGLLSLSNSYCQSAKHQISDFFRLEFSSEEDNFYFYADPDSLKSTPLEDMGKNMYAFSQFLYYNYSKKTQGKEWEKIKSYSPDSVKVITAFSAALEADSAFKTIYFNYLNKTAIPDIHIDSIITIASHFYYLHRLRSGRIAMHKCACVNEVLSFPQNDFSPYYNAFSFMVLRNREYASDEWLSFDNELTYTADEKISDGDLAQLRTNNYKILQANAAFRQNIINEYERRKEYLNFKMIY